MARPREFDETTVIQKATEVFWAKGYASTSIQDLVDATGLQRGSLYGAFGDKHGLYLATLDAYAAMGLATFRGHMTVAADPVDAIRDFVRMIGGKSRGDSAARGCMIGNTCSELAAHDEAARDRVQAFLGGMQASMAEALRAGQAQGSFDPQRDADGVAALITCSLQGIALLGKTNPDPSVVDKVVGELLRTLD